MTKKPLSPGTPTPRSGIYEQTGPRGGKTGEQADSTRGKPLPPTERATRDGDSSKLLVTKAADSSLLGSGKRPIRTKIEMEPCHG
jgi:hypothetical protein